MSTLENKQLAERIFADLAQGDGTAFIDSMADDIRWNMIGGTKWSKSYEGKHAVRTELLGPVFAHFADRYTNTAERIIAEDDYVVVQAQGRVMTKAGKRYDNQYCYVIRFADGKLHELTEYLDTELVTAALSD